MFSVDVNSLKNIYNPRLVASIDVEPRDTEGQLYRWRVLNLPQQ